MTKTRTMRLSLPMKLKAKATNATRMSPNGVWTGVLVLAAVAGSLCVAHAASRSEKVEKENGTKMPPPFFLQDPTDSLCLAGEEFKRCSIDTLWYATGTSGDYQIHKRPVDGVLDDQEDGLCLSKKSCKEGDIGKRMDAKVTKCSNCGAKGWYIMGENESGYTIMNDGTKTCLARIPANVDNSNNNNNNDKAVTAPCDHPDTPLTRLQLQFASVSDLATMSSPGARLVSAATDGDKKQVQAILKEDGVDINVVDWDGLNALIPAASAGHLDLCKYLIQQGIDVNAADKDGITALMEASIMGHVKVVEFLLDHASATVDKTANSGITALWLAASEGQDEVLKILLAKGADPANTRVDDISALMTAAVGGHASTVKLLLEQEGVTAMAVDKEGLTPLMNAAEKGNLSVIQSLVQSVPEEQRAAYINQFSTLGFTALLVACAHGNAEAVSFLLENGGDPTVQVQDSGVTALMYAAANTHTEVMKVLLAHPKVDIDQRHWGGGTALVECGMSGASESFELLIQGGADVNARDNDGVSALMGIASVCGFDGMKYIWDTMEAKGLAKDELNRMSFSGGTPIMFAAAGGHLECVQFFLDQGARLDVQSKATEEYLAKVAKAMEAGTADETQRHVDGVTPLHVAAQGGHLECVQAMLQAGADTSVLDALGRTALTVAIQGNFGETAIALVKAGSDPNTLYTDEDGKEHNLLFDAIMVENEDFAKALIEKGASLSYKDEKSVSTLLQASHRGLTEVAELLLKANTKGSAYVDGASDEGVTPLLAASSEGHDDIVSLLIQVGGANVNIADNDGTTPLMAASARGHVPVVKALITAGAKLNEQNQDGHTALMFAYNGKNQVETLAERYSQYYAEQQQQATSAQKQEQQKNGGILDDDTGAIITEALSNHTALVDLLLSSGADVSLKDKEGHQAKDFDYQADNPAVFAKGSISGAGSSSSSNGAAGAKADAAKEEL